MNLEELRAKYPQYQDMSDGEFASAFHKKFYSDMPFEEFSGKIGLSAGQELVSEGGPNPAQYAKQRTSELIGGVRDGRAREAYKDIYGINPSRTEAFSSNLADSVMFGQMANLQAAGDAVLGRMGGGQSSTRDMVKQRQKKQWQDQPLSSGAGQAAGLLAPGAVGYNLTKTAKAAIPGGVALATRVGQSGRGQAYAMRMADEVSNFAGASALTGLYSNPAASGNADSVGGKIETAKEWGTSPFNLLPIAGSLVRRGGQFVATKGASATPAKQQAQAAERFNRAAPSSVILDATRQQAGIPRKSFDGIVRVLSQGGYSSDDIAAGIRGLLSVSDQGKNIVQRPGLFVTELQKKFPQASQQIQDVFQQLATAPPNQGNTSKTLLGAIDDQYASQDSFLRGVGQERLGTSTVTDDLTGLLKERQQIGEVRDRTIRYAATDARGKGVQGQMRDFVDDFSDDREVMGAMRTAARQMGYSGKREVDDAMRENPALLMQKFGEVAGKQERSARGASTVMQQARQESEQLFDELSRYNRADDSLAFAPRADGPVGPYKQQQQRFRQNYTQEDTIFEARGKFQQAGDPVKAEAFVGWYNGLPAGEQQLVKTVIRQDMETMLRGGKIDGRGADIGRLKSKGLNDVLVKLFGREGEEISSSIRQISDEQTRLKNIDPRQGLQSRVVKPGSKAYKDSLDLYSTGVTGAISRAGHKVPAMGGFATDATLVMAGQLPYATMFKQAAKVFRPRTRTREGIARTFAMRPGANPPQGPANALATVTPPPAGGAAALQGPPSGPQAQAPPPRAPQPPPIYPGDTPPQQKVNPIARGLQAMQRTLAKPEDPRFFSNALRGTVPDEVKPYQPYLEQQLEPMTSTIRLGQIAEHGAQGPARQVNSYLRGGQTEMRQAAKAGQQAVQFNDDLMRAEVDYRSASQQLDEIASRGGKGSPALRQAEERLFEAGQRLRALQGSEPPQVPMIPSRREPTLNALENAMSAARSSPRDAPFNNALSVGRRARQQGEYVDLVTNPDRADDAYRIAKNQPEFDSFKNTSRAAIGAAGVGAAAAYANTIKNNMPEREIRVPQGNYAAEVQDFLAVEGFYASGVDGMWGKDSEEALKAYQRANGLIPDGRWTLSTANRISQDMARVRERRAAPVQ